MNKIQLNDLTFVIPVYIDSKDRIFNVNYIIDYLYNNFNSKIIVCENSKVPLFEKYKNEKFEYHFLYSEDDIFHKTKTLNYLYNKSKTKFICAEDTDILVNPNSIKKAYDLLKENKYNFVYPFNSDIYDITKNKLNILESNKYIKIDKEYLEFRCSKATGCIFMFNKKEFEKYGLENENFIGWGAEDDERYTRLEKLGNDIFYIQDGPVYHIKHFRGKYSRPLTGFKNYKQDNVDEFKKVKNLSKEELLSYIKSGFKKIEKHEIINNKNTIIFVDDSIIKEYDINNFYDKLILELSGFRLLYFCEKNYNKIYDNIEIINKQFSLDKNWNELLFKNIKFNYNDKICFIHSNFNISELIKDIKSFSGKNILKDKYSITYGLYFNKIKNLDNDKIKEKYTSFKDAINSFIIDYEKNDYNYKWESFREKLNSVGKGFCLAKWEQVTLHLHNGDTHSCHLPWAHKVPVDEVKKNYKAIHNSNFKKEVRKQMMEGKRPSECQYCWNIEDSDPNIISDRVQKSMEFAPENFEKIKNSNYKDDYSPSYVEVSFSNKCNFACGYCSPIISSKFNNEIKKYGGYKLCNNTSIYEDIKFNNTINNDNNEYIKSFWKWLPELYNNLKFLRITGGEPLMDLNTFKLIDHVIENPNKNLEFSINTNLNPPENMMKKLFEKLDILNETKSVKKITIYSSIDTYGKQAEYIRYGLNFEKFRQNLEYILDKYEYIQVSIMSTFNIFSLPNFNKLIDYVYTLKKHYNTRDNCRVYMDTPYLRSPNFISIIPLFNKLTKTYLEEIKYNIYKYENNNNIGFLKEELIKIDQVYLWFEKTIYKDFGDDNIMKHNLQKSFYLYFKEYDRRKNLNILEYFPEYTEFWKYCQELCNDKN